MDEERVYLYGNTYPVKEELKRIGARWDPKAWAWHVAESRVQEANRIINGEIERTPGQRRDWFREQLTPKKQCWKCRRQFTLASSRKFGGSWIDSWCGQCGGK